MSVEKLPLAVPRPEQEYDDLEWAQADLIMDPESDDPQVSYSLGDGHESMPKGFERADLAVGAPPLFWDAEPASPSDAIDDPGFLTGDPNPEILAEEPEARIRVPFSTPLLLQVDGDDLAHEGAVTNLSAGGVGCLSTADLQVGQAVWASFALPDDGHPISVVCQVVWRRELAGEHRIYGLSFAELAPQHAQRLERLAAGLPLTNEYGEPLAELDRRDGPTPRSTWGSAAMGVAVGIALALGVTMVFSNRDLPASSGEPSEVQPGAVASHDASLANLEGSSHDGEVAPSAPNAQVVPPVDAPSPEPSPAALPPVDAAKAPVASEVPGQTDEKVAAAPLPARDRAPQADRDDVLRPVGDADRMPLELLTDGPVDQHITFWLSHPRRLVIDVPGRKSGFKRHRYTIDHPLASQLRVGNHPGKVRFVLETVDAVSPEIFTTQRGNALAIEIRRASRR